MKKIIAALLVAALLAALLLESALSSGLLRLVWEHFIAA